MPFRPCAPEPCPAQLRLPGRSEPALELVKLFAAFCRAREHVFGRAVAIKAKQRENCAGAAAHDVQLFVGGDEFVGEKFARPDARRRAARRRSGTSPSRRRRRRPSPGRWRRRCQARAPCAPRSALQGWRRCESPASASSPEGFDPVTAACAARKTPMPAVPL